MSPEERQASRPADEIEVTPEMVKAGIRAWIDADYDFAPQDEIVKRIFLAMLNRHTGAAD